jgi:hypothetical protein
VRLKWCWLCDGVCIDAAAGVFEASRRVRQARWITRLPAGSLVRTGALSRSTTVRLPVSAVA